MSNNASLTLDELITKIKDELDELDTSHLNADTEFRKMEGWSSLYSLVLMAMVATEYGIELEAEQIRDIKTVADLHQKIIAA